MRLGDATRLETTARGFVLHQPALPGEHAFELKTLEPPPIFRNWQAASQTND